MGHFKDIKRDQCDLKMHKNSRNPFAYIDIGSVLGKKGKKLKYEKTIATTPSK